MLRAETISTERLLLQPLRADFAPELVGVFAGEELYSFTGGGPPSLPELEERFAAQEVGHSPDGTEIWLNWIVRLAGDATPVGTVQATVVGATASLAWVIGLGWQGNGYATEAALGMATWLEGRGVVGLSAAIHPLHRASGRVAEHLGMEASDERIGGERIWRRAR
jgi:RimJ/RimL family protein N-acetyltransferase